MNIFFRFFYFFFKERLLNKHVGLFEVSKIKLRVWLNDLDLYRHVNNGKYFSLMDIGRVPLWWSTPLGKKLQKNKLYFVIYSETISFRKSLKLNQKYSIESKIIGFDDKGMFIEQRFVVKNEIYARAFVYMRLLRKEGGSVTMEELGNILNINLSDYPAPSWRPEWNKFNNLPPTKDSADNIW